MHRPNHALIETVKILQNKPSILLTVSYLTTTCFYRIQGVNKENKERRKYLPACGSNNNARKAQHTEDVSIEFVNSQWQIYIKWFRNIMEMSHR